MQRLRKRLLRGKHCAASARSKTSLDSLAERIHEALVPAAVYLDARDLKSAVLTACLLPWTLKSCSRDAVRTGARADRVLREARLKRQ